MAETVAGLSRAEYMRRWRLANPEYVEKERAKSRAWYHANTPRARDNLRKWQAANRSKVCANSRKWRAENSEKAREIDKVKRQKNPEKYRLISLKGAKKWQAANRGKVNAVTSSRRTAKLQRTPPWADLIAIREIYEMAAEMTAKTGEAWHVDHEIPLQGKLVSGLHVAENLQLLPGKENCRKSNTFNP